jgi:uncharacterized protein YtpQ (UPF0354 family)
VTSATGKTATVYPDNLYRGLLNTTSPAERASVLQDYVQGALLALAQADTDLPLAVGKVYPVLRPANYLPKATLSSLPHQAFPGGLTEFWAMDTDSAIISLSFDQITKAGMDLDHLKRAGLANLTARLAEVQIKRFDGIRMVVLDGTYESSLVFLPALWQGLDDRMGRVVVAVLARDILLLADGDDQSQIATLRRVAKGASTRFEHPISEDLFLWTGSDWQALR